MTEPEKVSPSTRVPLVTLYVSFGISSPNFIPKLSAVTVIGAGLIFKVALSTRDLYPSATTVAVTLYVPASVAFSFV